MSPLLQPPIMRDWPPSDAEERQTLQTEQERKLYDADNRADRSLRRWARRSDVRRRFVRPGAWLFVAVAAFETAGLGLQAADTPEDWWGDNDKTDLDYVVTLIGAASVILAAVLAAAYAKLHDARAADRRLEELARSIAREVSAITKKLSNGDGIALDHISVHVWQVRDPTVWLVIPNWWPWRQDVAHLTRRAAYVPERREHEGFAFRIGMGVVGRCWERRREVVEDLSKIHAGAPDAPTYYANFDYVRRYRLSFAQLWNTRHFHAIWAYPLFLGPAGDKTFGGCISVDFQCRGRANDLSAVADNRSEELDSLLADCASLLRGEVPAA